MDIHWGAIDTAGSGKASWMEQIYQYTMNTNVYNCPANIQLPPDLRGPFNYFNGCRAAYLEFTNFAALQDNSVRFPASYVLSGDTCGIPNVSAGEGGGTFDPYDADKDDYTQNCVGGATNGTPYELWQVHSSGQNILFVDGHTKWYKGYSANDMTFHYADIEGWE
jgi:prepilin-type processing-associated H-X9-DG protein